MTGLSPSDALLGLNFLMNNFLGKRNFMFQWFMSSSNSRTFLVVVTCLQASLPRKKYAHWTPKRACRILNIELC